MDLGFGQLLGEHGGMKRDAWEEHFGTLVDELKLGGYVMPATTHADVGGKQGGATPPVVTGGTKSEIDGVVGTWQFTNESTDASGQKYFQKETITITKAGADSATATETDMISAFNGGSWVSTGTPRCRRA